MLSRCFGFLFAFLALVYPVLGQYSIDTIAGSEAPKESLITLEDARGVAVDGQRNVYVSDPSRHRILKFSPNGVSVVAGIGQPGFSGDGGPADHAALNQPYGLAVDGAGNLFVADFLNGRVRRVGLDGRIVTFAGGGSLAVTTPNQMATDVALKAPRNVAVDGLGNVYISDFLDHRVLRVGPDGRISIAGGSGQPGPAADLTPALSGQLSYPAGLFIDAAGQIYVADSGNHAIRRIQSGMMVRLNIAAAASLVNLPTAVVVDSQGNLLIASAGLDQAVRVAPSGAASVIQKGARDLALDLLGNLYLTAGDVVRKVTPQGAVTALASGSVQFRGEGSLALQAWLAQPGDVKVDAAGAIYIADTNNHRVRKIAAGIITTLAGDGEASPAALSSPRGLAVDKAGNIYVADTGNHRIRRVSGNGQLTTVAGTGTAGFNGDVKEALLAQLQSPTAVAVDANGNLFIADTGNHRIRRLLSTGHLVTVAGNGTQGSSGDGGGSLNAQLDSPRGIVFDAQGNLYFADSGNNRVRRISPVGVITTVALNLLNPAAVAIDDTGTIWISDAGNHRIRRIDAAGQIATIAGTGLKGFSGDKGPALEAQLDDPSGIAFDGSGALLIADRGNHRIRRLTLDVVIAPLPPPAIEIAPLVTAVHGATLESTPAAPGLLLTLQGTGIGPLLGQSGKMGANGQLESTVGDTQVRFDGRAAPILYAQENLINVQVPYRVAGLNATLVEIVKDGKVKATTTLPVVPTAPGLFTSTNGSGPATALLDDSSLNAPANAVAAGGLVTIFATGDGLTNPVMVEGRLADFPFPTPVGAVVVTIGGKPAEIVSASSAATSPGVLQVMLRVPSGLTNGAQPLVLFVGGAASQKNVTLFVR